MEVRPHLPPGPVTIYLGLGSNLGDREANLVKALQLLSERLPVEQISSLYETEPVGYEPQPHFLNAVCCAKTEIGPFQLLSLIKGVEAALGRVPSFPNAPRPIDVDILFYGDLIIETPQLTIPHPRLEERAFVLIPLFELDAALVHPLSGERIGDLAARVQGREGVRKIGELRAAFEERSAP
jgi:2-amino-4-hydroxy-6-hydroxymethyldihydropteridine diphosphokinase